MRTVTIFTGNDLASVYMLKEMSVLQPEDQVHDEAKLRVKLAKAKDFAETKGKDVIGVASFTTADVTFFSDNTFSGRVWKGGFPVSGKWEF